VRESILTEAQARLLGAMVEKQLTTPQNYPMTPNAVRVACNQKNNRDPVVEYTDDVVFDTLKSLEKRGFLQSGLLDNTQTIKYRQTLDKALELSRGELVILCELFNRGAQTVGELRSRCDRMYTFAGLAAVEKDLSHLAERQFVVMLERQPGTKESRWAHLFCGVPRPATREPKPAGAGSGLEERVAALEALVGRLEGRIADLENR
jgi:uncharacterized protein YceH (UPF0502 family)